MTPQERRSRAGSGPSGNHRSATSRRGGGAAQAFVSPDVGHTKEPTAGRCGVRTSNAMPRLASKRRFRRSRRFCCGGAGGTRTQTGDASHLRLSCRSGHINLFPSGCIPLDPAPADAVQRSLHRLLPRCPHRCTRGALSLPSFAYHQVALGVPTLLISTSHRPRQAVTFRSGTELCYPFSSVCGKSGGESEVFPGVEVAVDSFTSGADQAQGVGPEDHAGGRIGCVQDAQERAGGAGRVTKLSSAAFWRAARMGSKRSSQSGMVHGSSSVRPSRYGRSPA